MKTSASNIYGHKIPNNIQTLVMWKFSQLIFNLVVWNVLVGIVLILNSTVFPVTSESPMFFKVLHNEPALSFILISLVAFFSWLLEEVIFYRFLNTRGFSSLVGFRILFVSLMALFTFTIVFVYHYQDTIRHGNYEYISILANAFIVNKASIYIFFTINFLSIGISFFKAIIFKIGSEKFIPYITGQLRVPKEEQRIFIFIDLVSSTHIAESLGHRKYSLLIQDCFKHLGLLEIKYRAMHYQFVGDEVVLSWPAKPKNYLNAVHFFLEYQQILKSKDAYFKHHYDLTPKFSAAINCGMVMVSEIGTIRSEIAFHGDVLNTASRVQKLCKTLDKPLLLTGAFAQQYNARNPVNKAVWIKEATLSGKQESVNIYSIEGLTNE